MLELFISQCQYKQSSVLAAIERKLNRILKKGVFVLSLVVFSEFCSESLQEDDRCLQLNSVASLTVFVFSKQPLVAKKQ